MLNRPRIDDDALDQPVQPMNVLYGGQPAVTVPTEDPGTRLASRKPKTKAVPRAPQRRRDEAAAKLADIFVNYFDRQERSMTAALGSKKKALSDLFEQWNDDLIQKLEPASLKLVRQTGEAAAAQIAGTFTAARTIGYVLDRTKRAAESINQTTFDAIEEAFDDEGLDGVRRVFEEAKTSRSERLGLSTATGLIAFARMEAAKHSQEADRQPRTKTWVVTSGNSRHPEMNGETVPIFEPFSNGMQFPGDGVGGADEVAGCKCLLSLA